MIDTIFNGSGFLVGVVVLFFAAGLLGSAGSQAQHFERPTRLIPLASGLSTATLAYLVVVLLVLLFG